MASGKTHKKVNIITGFGLSIGAFLMLPLEVFYAVVLGSLTGTIITPDYDLNAALPSSFMTKIPVVKTFWGVLWRPYQLLVKHRSFFSHAPIVSTGIRAAYIFTCAWLVLQALSFWSIAPPHFNVSGDFLIPFFFAWAIQDLTHFVLDL